MTHHNLHSLVVVDSPKWTKVADEDARLGWLDNESYVFRVIDIPPTVTNAQVLHDVGTSAIIWCDPTDATALHFVRYNDIGPNSIAYAF